MKKTIFCRLGHHDWVTFNQRFTKNVLVCSRCAEAEDEDKLAMYEYEIKMWEEAAFRSYSLPQAYSFVSHALRSLS